MQPRTTEELESTTPRATAVHWELPCVILLLVTENDHASRPRSRWKWVNGNNASRSRWGSLQTCGVSFATRRERGDIRTRSSRKRPPHRPARAAGSECGLVLQTLPSSRDKLCVTARAGQRRVHRASRQSRLSRRCRGTSSPHGRRPYARGNSTSALSDAPRPYGTARNW